MWEPWHTLTPASPTRPQLLPTHMGKGLLFPHFPSVTSVRLRPFCVQGRPPDILIQESDFPVRMICVNEPLNHDHIV